MRRLIRVSVLTGALLASSGCSSLERLALRMVFEPASFPEERELHDVPYVEGEGFDPEKHRLDLFLPEGDGWPTLIFVHGGSWIHGDKDLTFGGEEIYGNIGRFYASRGVGVAVISYRLQPQVTWRQQVSDVAAAIAWIASEIEGHGGNPKSIFLSGHSAGAQLVTFTAASDALTEHGVDRQTICGVVPISGAGLDVADQKTYELGADPAFYERTFRDDSAVPDGEWQLQASATRFLTPADDRAMPAWLIFFGGKEDPIFERQARLLNQAAKAAGHQTRVVEIPKASHRRIVGSFSQRGEGLDAPTLAFIDAHRNCAEVDSPS